MGAYLIGLTPVPGLWATGPEVAMPRGKIDAYGTASLNSSTAGTASTAKYVNPVAIIQYDQGEVQTHL